MKAFNIKLHLYIFALTNDSTVYSKYKEICLLVVTRNIYLLRMITINCDLDVFASHVDCRIAKICYFVFEV